MPRPYIRKKPSANVAHQERYNCMLAFLEMLREAGAGNEVHADLYFNKIVAKAIDPRVALPAAPSLFRSFAASGFIELVKGKAFVSGRHGKNVIRVWKVTDKPIPKA